MIAVDTSALLAILFGEPEREQFRAVLDQDPDVMISAATVVEARMVTRGRAGDAMVQVLEELLVEANVAIVPLSADQADLAHDAFVRFGKGNGHPAQLNFGDLFSYALARANGIPLLFKGADFAATDIEPALPR